MTYSNNQTYFNQNMGSSYIEYEQQGQSQIIQNQPSQQGPISLPSLAGSLKNYTNNQTSVGSNSQQPKEEPKSSTSQKTAEPIRNDLSIRDKDKEADKAKKKGKNETFRFFSSHFWKVRENNFIHFLILNCFIP